MSLFATLLLLGCIYRSAAAEAIALEVLEQPHQAIIRAVLLGDPGQMTGVIVKPDSRNKAEAEAASLGQASDRFDFDKELAQRLGMLKRRVDERGLSAAMATVSLSGVYTHTRPWSWVPLSEGRAKFKVARPWLWRAAIANAGKEMTLVYGVGYPKDSFFLSTWLAEDVLSGQEWGMLSVWQEKIGENFDDDVVAMKVISRMSLTLAEIAFPGLQKVGERDYELRTMSAGRLIVHVASDGNGIQGEFVPAK